MPFLYHRVPKKVHGKTLYPLNTLKHKFPKAYEKEKEKYVEREEILGRKISILNCLWNDVLHLSPIHPLKIKKELMKAGFKPKTRKWFKINVNKLDLKKTIIFLNKYGPRTIKQEFDKKNFIKYDVKKLSQYEDIPKETKEYYSKRFKEGKGPLLRFYAAPHVFYKGNLDVGDVEIIEV